jgi:hypothetical protein
LHEGDCNAPAARAFQWRPAVEFCNFQYSIPTKLTVLALLYITATGRRFSGLEQPFSKVFNGGAAPFPPAYALGPGA